MQMSYWRFAAMIATSTVLMFVLMYLNTYALDHVLWSETRTWMAVMMGATMAVVMLGFMLGMYRKRAVNIAIFAGSAVVFALSLWLVRSQATVNEVEYMKAMIPHHSIAILTSERARISDPRVRKLADEISASQRREIAEMKYLVGALEENGSSGSAAPEVQGSPRVVPAREAITQAAVPETDLAELNDADIEKVLGHVPYCSFRYSRGARPVLAARMPAGGAGEGEGVVKLHGRLVELSVASAAARPGPATGIEFSADGIGVVLEPRPDGETETAGGTLREATVRLQLEAGLQVGYRGFYGCDAPPQ